MNLKIIITILLFISISSANLLKPQNGSELTYVHVYFECDQEPNAMTYNLQISLEPFFNNIIVDVEENSTAYIDKNNLNWDSMYYWRIRSLFDERRINECSSIPTPARNRRAFGI